MTAVTYKTNDPVIHPRHGAGTVQGFRTIERNGKKRRYFCIELLEERGIVLIPEEKVAEIGLRKAVVDADLIQRVMDNPPEELPSDYQQRKSRLRQRFDSGEPHQIIQVLRDLSWREKHTNLNTTDNNLKSKAIDMLAHELALKARIEVSSARRRINHIIDSAMQTHTTAASTKLN